MKGKWAQGIVPRHFAWILQDKLATCERPGGYGENHRKVRRQEEIIWLREQGFDPVISVIASPHNLHAYDELGLRWEHVPFKANQDSEEFLRRFYPRLRTLLTEGHKVLVHDEELSDRLAGTIAGYLVWAGLVPEVPRAVAMIERLLERQLGAKARTMVSSAANLADAKP